MLEYHNGSPFAIVVLHEIYGINPHIMQVCERYHQVGYDVYCPNLINKETPFPYAQQEEAYAHFKNNVGFDVCCPVMDLLKKLNKSYSHIFVIGFSVGATLAWRCSESGLCSGVIGFYGSRIRDYLDVLPKCPALLIFAENEPAFEPKKLYFSTEQQKHVTMTILEGEHGFCDEFSGHYNPESARKAHTLTQEFMKSLVI